MSIYSRPILSDENLNNSLSKEGYVVVPFITEEEVRALTDYFYASHPRQREGMYATAHDPDISHRIRMNDFIKKTFARAIGEYFVNCNPLGGSFIAKGKGAQGTLEPHQDWNITDEEQHRSFNIWVPLVNLTQENGTILIIPGSHAWLKNYRSANIDSAFLKVNDAVWKMLKPLYMKAGEALIYDHRLIHASGENQSDEIRLASVYGIIPDGAKMYYYHKAGGNTVEVFESNTDFYLYQNIFEGPKGLKAISRMPYDFHEVDETELHQLSGSGNNSFKQRLSSFRRIWRSFAGH